ncbi:MAG: phosphotransferase [Synoicihabitans sp.]
MLIHPYLSCTPLILKEPINWSRLATTFGLPKTGVQTVPYGSGHINDTYAVTLEVGSPHRYIFQRINQRVFRNVPALMENIQRVTNHIPHGLELVPTTSGGAFHHDEQGAFWRCYVFIENAATHDVVTSPVQAREAAYSFGEFQGQLIDLPGARLHETIPDFHHTRRRFDRLRSAVDQDCEGRRSQAEAEIAFALEREPMVDRLLERAARGEIPERITHNDTKINNVMLDDTTSRGVAVIDLDTVMPGLALYDFGDMVRTATNSAEEDERDLKKVESRLDMFDALAEGYLASAGSFLNQAEQEELVFSGRLMTFEVGIRFLTDHLEGDVYFKTHRSNHNLERARCQFALVQSMEENAEEMAGIIASHLER